MVFVNRLIRTSTSVRLCRMAGNTVWSHWHANSRSSEMGSLTAIPAIIIIINRWRLFVCTNATYVIQSSMIQHLCKYIWKRTLLVTHIVKVHQVRLHWQVQNMLIIVWSRTIWRSATRVCTVERFLRILIVWSITQWFTLVKSITNVPSATRVSDFWVI